MTEIRAELIKTIGRYDIPASLAREVGRFIVTWAHFENYVQSIIWACLEMRQEIGRIAVREPRVQDRLDIIRDLGEADNVGMDYLLLREIRKAAIPLAAQRHLLAHSVWLKANGDWNVQLTRGTWEEIQGLDPDHAPTGSKAVNPEAVTVSVADVREWIAQTVQLIENLQKLGDHDRPVPKPSPRKPREPRARAAPKRGQGP